MVHPQQHYRTLLAQAKQLLAQQYKQDAWLLADKETCDFFRQRAAQAGTATQPRQQAIPATPLPPRQAVKPIVRPPSPRPVVPPQSTPQAPSPTPNKENIERRTSLMAPTAQTVDDLKEWKEIVQKVAPKMKLLDGPPTAQEALLGHLEQASVWIVIPEKLLPAERKFLSDLAHALTLHERTACVVPEDAVRTSTYLPKQVLSIHNAAPDTLQNISTPLAELSSLLDDADAKAGLWKKLTD